MKKLLLTLSIALISNCTFAQAPAIEWQKSYGSSGFDFAQYILPTSDGGFIISGYCDGHDGDVTGNHGSFDLWIVKLSSQGTIQWQKSLGGSVYESDPCILQTTDGGYIIAGGTNSNDGDVTGNHGGWDYWVVKLSDSGSIQWQKTYGGSAEDHANSIVQTSDGGYIVAGAAASNNGDVTGNHGSFDYWVVKISTLGIIQWQKTYGGSGDDEALSILQTSEGGYIVAGISSSNNGDVTGNHGDADYWIVKLSDLGVIQWQKSLGGAGRDFAWSIQQTTDGGYVVAGNSASTNGDVTENHGGADYWAAKLSASGAIQWQKSLGGSGDDEARSVKQTSDGGFVICGYSYSNDGDVTGNNGNYDYWVVKLSSSGNLQWQKALGGTTDDMAYSVQQTSDGGYIVGGWSKSYDGDVSGNHGSSDYWIVKLEGNVSVKSVTNNTPVTLFPNPSNGTISVKGADMLTIKAYNMVGQLIKEAGQADNISLSEFPAGMYFIKLYNEKGEMVQVNKIVKQ